MTLINFLTRVHFADGVLEEALYSEIEANGKRRPLVIAEETRLSNVMGERFYSSFPLRSAPITFSDIPNQPTEAAAREIATLYRDNGCDLLIAFGSSRAMDLAKVSRIAIAYDEPIASLSTEEGGARRINGALPCLYSIPGILGFASAISDYARVKLDTGGQVLLSSRNLIPSVTICDPTLTLGASDDDSACAAGGILARSIDSYLSPRYHPPADGLALDALSRVRRSAGGALRDDDLSARREMMAAGLNSSLSLQKGLCVVHAICNAIASASEMRLDPSALGGVMIPHLVKFYAADDFDRGQQVKHSLGMTNGETLSEGLLSLTADWGLPQSLSSLGVAAEALPIAAEQALNDRAIVNGPRGISATEIREMLETAH